MIYKLCCDFIAIYLVSIYILADKVAKTKIWLGLSCRNRAFKINY